MPTFIPVEVRQVLNDFGFVAPDKSEWKRGVPCTQTRERPYFCSCDGHRHGIYRFAHLGGRRVMIAQCDACRLIHWCEVMR